MALPWLILSYASVPTRLILDTFGQERLVRVFNVAHALAELMLGSIAAHVLRVISIRRVMPHQWVLCVPLVIFHSNYDKQQFTQLDTRSLNLF